MKKPAENVINVIYPYKDEYGTWMFDDPSVGLDAEPFVSGIPEMLDAMTSVIPFASDGFRLMFSASPFPGAIELTRMHEEADGAWYKQQELGMEGWLCGAIRKYFREPPQKLYIRVAEKLDR